MEKSAKNELNTYMQQCWDIGSYPCYRDVENPELYIRPDKNLHEFLHILC